jgi:hypothetical protein
MKINVTWFICIHDYVNLNNNPHDLGPLLEAGSTVMAMAFSDRHKCKKCGKLKWIGGDLYI